MYTYSLKVLHVIIVSFKLHMVYVLFYSGNSVQCLVNKGLYNTFKYINSIYLEITVSKNYN